MEAEWEKMASKAIRQEAEYEAQVGAMDAMEESLAGLEFGPNALSGPEGPASFVLEHNFA